MTTTMNNTIIEGSVIARRTEATPVYSWRIGQLPTPRDLIPSTATGVVLSIAALTAGVMVSSTFGANSLDAILWGMACALMAALIRQIDTRQQRKGCIFKEGGVRIIEHWEDPNAPSRSMIDADLTDTYKAATGNDNILVERRQSEQYNIHVVFSDDPDQIKTAMRKIAVRLGSKPEELLFYPVWGKGCSAVLAHRPMNEWKNNPVAFDPSAVIQERMILQAGRSITGKTMTYDREVHPHALIAGESGAGKTEAMVVDMHAARATGLNPRVFVIDPKNTPALKRLKGTTYTNEAETGINILKQIVALCEERINRYSAASCDNYHQYRNKGNKQEQPICLYIDEVAELVSPDVATDKKEAKEIADSAKALITRLVQKYRSAGLFVTLGMQHPLAEVLSTNIRNNLGIRIVMSVQDHKAAGVAGVPGAENLPMQGGMILKQGKTLTYGRGVYLAAQH